MIMYKRLKSYLASIYDPFPYRRYTNKYRCIYIHIPKSAGTSILTALQNGRPHRDHANIKDFYRFDPVRAEKYFKFSFVRNPYDRLASAFFYLQRGGNGSKKDLKIKDDFLKLNIFSVNDFVHSFLNEYACSNVVLLRTQYSFFVDDSGRFKMDFVGKYENLENDFPFVAEKLGFPMPKLPKLNVSGDRLKLQGGYQHLFDEESLKKIERLYSDDFEKFSYLRRH